MVGEECRHRGRVCNRRRGARGGRREQMRRGEGSHWRYVRVGGIEDSKKVSIERMFEDGDGGEGAGIIGELGRAGE